MNDTDEKPEMMSWEEYSRGRNPKAAREAELAKIWDRADAVVDGQAALSSHDTAVKNFDERHRDVIRYPAGLNKVMQYRQEAINDAAAKGEVIRDWPAKLDEIADRARKDMGLKPLFVQEHEADMAEMKQDREKGKKPLPQE